MHSHIPTAPHSRRDAPVNLSTSPSRTRFRHFAAHSRRDAAVNLPPFPSRNRLRHSASSFRRTFICFALASGIPPQVVMKWTGHSDYKAMKPYIDIAEKVKAEQMSIFEKGLDG